ncbi:Mu-like prophage major head subunit gpT family protein, partial [Xanthomonas citri]
DFKQQSRVLLGSAPELLLVPEGGEYAFGRMDEDKSVPYSVKKFGRLVQLTWEALVNDDLGAFLRITQAMGQAAARAEGDAVYATFADNAAAGTTMQDGRPLFHADHKNLATSFNGITADALAAARVLL